MYLFVGLRPYRQPRETHRSVKNNCLSIISTFLFFKILCLDDSCHPGNILRDLAATGSDCCSLPVNFVSQSQTGLASQSGFASQSQSGLASQSGFASQSQSGFAGQSQAGFAGQSQSGFAGQSQAGFAGQSQASSFSTSDLVAQIVLALQPQVAETVQLAIQVSTIFTY